MKTIYAVRDRLANELVGLQMYTLFVFRTDQQAVRYFQDAINDPSSVFHKHPSDYELIEMGQLDEQENGTYLSGDHSNRVVATGDAIVAAQTPKTKDTKRHAQDLSGPMIHHASPEDDR